MYNFGIHGLVNRDSLTERRENPAKQASSMLRESGCHPSFMRPPSLEPSSQGFLLSGPHTCGTSVVCADQTLTRASQRGHGGLRIEPGGGVKKTQAFGRSKHSSLFNAMRRHGSGKHFESEGCFSTVEPRFTQTLTKKHILESNE